MVRWHTAVAPGAYGGFLLVHMIVYIALTSLIIMYTMQWAASCMIHNRASVHKNNCIMTLACATDVWVRDMRMAVGRAIPHDQAQWIWRIGNEYISWYVKNHALIRAQGTYAHGTWQGHTQSLMVEGIDAISVQQEEQTICMTVTTTGDQAYTCTRIVCTHNRVRI